MSKKQELLALFGAMEAERQEMIKSLEDIDHAILERKPNTDKWAVSEVMMHMVSAEGGALAYMKKKIDVNNHGPISGTAARFTILTGALKLPVKYKAPKIAADVGSGVPYSEALEKWNAVRSEMEIEYENLDESWVGHDLFKHPIAGKFDLIQGIKFMKLHANRHIGQIHRTVKLFQ